MSACRGSQSLCSLPHPCGFGVGWGGQPRRLPEQAGFSLLGRNVPVGSDLVTCVPQGDMKEEGKLGGEVCPLEASGAGSVWLLPSDKPPAKSDWIGAVMGGSAKHSSPPGNCSCLHSGRIWKAFEVRNISFDS